MTDLSRLPPGTHRLPSGCVVTIRSASLPGAKGGKRAGDLGPGGRVVSAAAGCVVVAFSIPPRELWPNGRPNPFAKARAVRAHRDTARMTAAAAVTLGRIGKPWERATLQTAFYWPDLRRRDEGNAVASLKAYIDGLVDGGLLVDDSTANLRHLPATFDIDRKAPRVDLTIERLA
jgi:hypothetical protein